MQNIKLKRVTFHIFFLLSLRFANILYFALLFLVYLFDKACETFPIFRYYKIREIAYNYDDYIDKEKTYFERINDNENIE